MCERRWLRRTWTRQRVCSKGPRQSYAIGANDQLLSSKDYQSVIVAYRNGAPVRLSDVANVVDGVENVAAGRVDEHAAGGDPEYSAAAGRKHHRRCGSRSSSVFRNCRRRCPHR